MTSDEMKAKLQEAREFMDMQREKGSAVPSVISDENLEYLAELSKRKRRGYLAHLFKKELKKLKKAEEKKKKEEEMAKEGPEPQKHQTWNAILRRMGRRDFDALAEWRLAAAIKFNPQIVFDCIYEDMMAWQDIRSLASQFAQLYSDNWMAQEPFYIRFVNFNPDGLIARELKKMYGDSLDDNLMVDFNTKSLLDNFSRSALVYLSPDSDRVFTSYNPNKVYVIGALVDKNRQEVGASLSQAKQLGIEHCRLPLDAYFHWSEGSHKNMTLDAMGNIFVELNTHGDMGKALEKWIPQRKQGGLRFDIGDKNVQNVLLRSISDQGSSSASNHKKLPRKDKKFQKKRQANLKSSFYESGDRSPFSYSRVQRPRQERGHNFDPEWQTSNRSSKNRNLSFEGENRPKTRHSQTSSHAKQSKKWNMDEE